MNGSFIKRHGGVKVPDRACVLSHVARILELVAIPQLVKNLPVVQETQVGSLGQEDPLEKEIGIHSCVFAWKIPWTEEPGGLQSVGSQSQTRLSH